MDYDQDGSLDVLTVHADENRVVRWKNLGSSPPEFSNDGPLWADTLTASVRRP